MKKLLLIIAILCVIATPLISASYSSWSISHAYTQEIFDSDGLELMCMSQTNSYEIGYYELMNMPVAEDVDSTLFIGGDDYYYAYFNTGEHLNYKDHFIAAEATEALAYPFMFHWVSSLTIPCNFDDNCDADEDSAFCQDCRMEFIFPTVQASTVSEVRSTGNVIYVANENYYGEFILYANNANGNKIFSFEGYRSYPGVIGEADETYIVLLNHNNGRCYHTGYNDDADKYFIGYMGVADSEWGNESAYILPSGWGAFTLGYDSTGNIWSLEWNETTDYAYVTLYDADLTRLDSIYFCNFSDTLPLYDEYVFGEYFEIEDDTYIMGYVEADFESMENTNVVLKAYKEVDNNIVLKDTLRINSYLPHSAFNGLNEEEDETYIFIPGQSSFERLKNIFPTVQAIGDEGLGLNLKVVRYDYDTDSFELVLDDSTVFPTYFNEGTYYPDFMTYDVRNDQLLVGVNDFDFPDTNTNYVYVFDLIHNDLFGDFWNGILYHSFDVYLAVLGEFFFGMLFGFIGAGIFVNNRNYSTITTYLVLVGVFFAIIMPTHIVGVFGIILAFLIGSILFKAFVDK